MAPLTYDFEETKRQIVELETLREKHRQRLSVLQVQAAQFGLETPPHITTEIEDIDKQITGINAKIAQLQVADELQRIAIIQAIPDPKSLVPVSVVPAAINERLLTLALSLENLKDEMRRNFTAVQLASQRDTDALWTAITDTRDMVSGEREDRIDWQERADDRRRLNHRIVLRWLWVIGAGVVLLFVILAIYMAVEYVREVVIPQAVGR